MNRPNISGLDPEIISYIESLERELARYQAQVSNREHRASNKNILEEDILDQTEIPDPTEPATTISVIASTESGIAKRTLRHLYNLQRRGGMGIFDMDTTEKDPPSILAIADQPQNLLVITNMGRAYRLPVQAIPETTVRAHGSSIIAKFSLSDDEKIASILPEQSQGYLAIVSQNGMVRMLRHHVFGEYMKPGTPLYDYRLFGVFAGATWTPGDGDLFIATQQGRAIRFSEKLVPPQGSQGIRLADQDKAVSICAVYPDSGIFLLSADGRGTIRMMETFAPNKAPGAGGKIALSTDQLICALKVETTDHIFIISSLSKIIRFRASEIPPKDGVVQGVVCISLRADQPVAAITSPTN
jgi:DNA gyrase subunit A